MKKTRKKLLGSWKKMFENSRALTAFSDRGASFLGKGGCRFQGLAAERKDG